MASSPVKGGEASGREHTLWQVYWLDTWAPSCLLCDPGLLTALSGPHFLHLSNGLKTVLN